MKVSVITPSYNQGQFIEETILSVLKQSYKDIEYIVIDGGSTDNTLKIIDKYRNRIKHVLSEPDNGQADAINKGFKLATGDLVGWINSDDILYTNCIEEIVKLALQYKDGVIYYPSKVDFINSEGEKLHQVHNEISNKQHLLNINYDVIQQGSFYKHNAVSAVNGVNEKLHYCMDLDLWLKLLEAGEIYYYDKEALAGFRMWQNSKTVKEEVKFLDEIQRVLRSHGMKATSNSNRKLYVSKFRKRIKHFINKPEIAY